MKTFDFAVGLCLVDVQSHAVRLGWRLIKAKWVGAQTDKPHWRALYIPA